MQLEKLIIICPLIFISGILDAIVGSGALISIPTYIVSGLPTHYAYGTNKFASFLGTFTSAVLYIKEKRFDIKSVSIFAIICMIGSAIGSKLTLYLSDIYLKYILVVILPILIFLLIIKGNVKDLLNNDNVEVKLPKFKMLIFSLIFGLAMGFYGGFLGVGTTSFLILIFINFFKLSSVKACGNARIVNCCLNLVAMSTFLFSGKIVFEIAIPAAISSMLGNYIGAGLAIKKENKIIKPLFIIIFIVLFIKLICDLILN